LAIAHSALNPPSLLSFSGILVVLSVFIFVLMLRPLVESWPAFDIVQANASGIKGDTGGQLPRQLARLTQLVRESGSRCAVFAVPKLNFGKGSF
jgi:hypothetical protein